MTSYKKGLTLIGILFATTCAHQASQSETSTSRNVINWGDNFSTFWTQAKDLPFPVQLSLWDKIVEEPQKKFYSTVVWRETESPDSAQRKRKRLEQVFADYSRKSAEIQSNFRKFQTTLELEISKFKARFPSATFSLPIMAVPAPTFNGKTDSYEDNGRKHFLAFGIDTLTIRDDNPEVLYSHELFHVYHGEASGIRDDGTAEDATLIDSLWAEGLATYVSHELNPSASMQAVFMDSALADQPEEKLKYLAKEFLKVKNEMVHSKNHPEIYGQWFLLNKCPSSLAPCRSGYFLGYHVARLLREKFTLDEMAHWSFKTAHEKIGVILQGLAGS